MAAGLVAGCEAPEIGAGDCTIECEDNGDCPHDMTCLEGQCVHKGRVEACGAGDADAGGGGSDGAEMGGVAGTGTAGSPLGDGGTEETGGTTEATTGGQGGAAGNVGGTGGRSTVGGGSGVAGSGGYSGENVGGGSTGGAAGEPGGAATGGAGAGGCSDPATIPVIDAQELTPACLGEVYSATLTATGGGDYAWSSDLPEGLGLELSDEGVLSGVLANTGEYSFDVSVEDTTTGCAAEPQRFTLVVRGETATDCPTIHIESKPPGYPAPPACAAWPYLAKLAVEDHASSEYTWAATTPEGLEFDPASQTVTGTAATGGTLTVRVTDNENGRVVQRSFSVPLRESCWFAHISSESGASRLHLVDPLLIEQLPSARKQRPISDSTDLTVEDFQFSPNGRFIAYRVKDETDAFSLWLWQGPEWDHEQELDLGGSVSHYAWSGDGLVLAAAIETDSGTLLGGVDVTMVPDVATSAGIQDVQELEPISAPVDSEITWYGNDGYVAFHSRLDLDPDLDLRIYHDAARGTSGFADGVPWDMYPRNPSLSLLPSTLGFFVADPVLSTLEFVAIGSNEPVPHGNVAISSDGSWVASAVDNTLSVYRATDTSYPPAAAPFASAPDCSNLLAWTADARRQIFVCLNSTAGRVQIYDLDMSSETIAIVNVTNSEAYATGPWEGLPHIISSNGSRIALVSDGQIYMGALDPVAPLASNLLPGSASPFELSFSPDEQLLMLHRGTSILLSESTSADSWSTVAYTAVAAEPCQDTQLAQPNWCGTQSGLTHPTWSADSQLLGVAQEDGTLIVLDLRHEPRLEMFDDVLISSDCGVDCVGTGRFQP